MTTPDPRALPTLERNAKIVEMRSAGAHCKVIAGTFGISEARVSQIVGAAKRQAAAAAPSDDSVPA